LVFIQKYTINYFSLVLGTHKDRKKLHYSHRNCTTDWWGQCPTAASRLRSPHLGCSILALLSSSARWNH